MVALTIALARPQIVERERVIEQEGIDIQIVLDTSGSMEAEDFVVAGRAASRIPSQKGSGRAAGCIPSGSEQQWGGGAPTWVNIH